jgi:hypothetical protein
MPKAAPGSQDRKPGDSRHHTLSPRDYDAVPDDLDGVPTGTAISALAEKWSLEP